MSSFSWRSCSSTKVISASTPAARMRPSWSIWVASTQRAAAPRTERTYSSSPSRTTNGAEIGSGESAQQRKHAPRGVSFAWISCHLESFHKLMRDFTNRPEDCHIAALAGVTQTRPPERPGDPTIVPDSPTIPGQARRNGVLRQILGALFFSNHCYDITQVDSKSSVEES
jgi:hypothetical protein